MNEVERNFLSHLRSCNFYNSTPSQRNIVRHASHEGLTVAEAAEVAKTWGYSLVHVTYKHKDLVFQRRDVPKVEVTGGPTRDIVRGVPKAREEAASIKAETGHDVLDPDWYGPVEAVVATYQKTQNRWTGWLLLSFFLAWIGGLGAFANRPDTWSSWPQDNIVGVSIFGSAALVGVGLFVSSILRKRSLGRKYRETTRPQFDLLCRVLNVAEEELLAAVE